MEAVLSAEATYEDGDGEYRLFLCFDAPMIALHQSQESREVSLPPDTRTGVPSILTVYKTGTAEDVTEEFSAKLRELSVEAIPTGDGTSMELIRGEITQEFSGALFVVNISMWTENEENQIQWTLTMESGQVITLSQVLTVEEADALVFTPENGDISTLEQLQQVIDYLGNDAGPGVTVDIYLPAVTYEGDLFIRYRGVNLIGSPADTVLNGSITVISPLSEPVQLQDLTLVGQGGTGVEAHAPVALINCSLTGYDIAAAAYDGGWISALSSSFLENGVGIYLDSSYANHVDMGYRDCLFEKNLTAMEILTVAGDGTVIFPDSTFSGNGQNVNNRIGHPVDMSEAMLEPTR